MDKQADQSAPGMDLVRSRMSNTVSEEESYSIVIYISS
jgi:hypothetical protein